MGISDYHSVDGGDILTGRPYGYTEEYQSYEQTGSTTITYSQQYGGYAACPKKILKSNTTMAGHLSSCTGSQYYCSSGCNQSRPMNCPYCGVATTTQTFASCWGGSGCTVTYSNSPTYGYVTRTRTVTYDKQSGLFSIGIGVPYAALNGGLYSTRRGTVLAGHAYRKSIQREDILPLDT